MPRNKEKYARKTIALRRQYYNSVIRHNYRLLWQVLRRRGIGLVCMQYPLHRVDDLKRMFDSPEGIVFVDNERVFSDALRYGRYSDYFSDAFAGDFGHCTPSGNRLIASNLAQAVLKTLSPVSSAKEGR